MKNEHLIKQFTEESALKLITEYSALKGVNICSKSLNGHRHSLMGSLKTFNMLSDLNIWGPIYKNFVKLDFTHLVSQTE